ncbi:hypothetical protein O6H91_04G083300 [Diphasiastrum complanatum]|uniref:Uncharacterized protein n=1 Tax=Diphasiastrum complanatum TaxID=34168 RepID=A0ACC2DYS6_DIPCM|nr:hypothetical protein O6H91_04G083300 [Diphasiastrum complanatum]
MCCQGILFQDQIWKRSRLSDHWQRAPPAALTSTNIMTKSIFGKRSFLVDALEFLCKCYEYTLHFGSLFINQSCVAQVARKSKNWSDLEGFFLLSNIVFQVCNDFILLYSNMIVPFEKNI